MKVNNYAYAVLIIAAMILIAGCTVQPYSGNNGSASGTDQPTITETHGAPGSFSENYSRNRNSGVAGNPDIALGIYADPYDNPPVPVIQYKEPIGPVKEVV